MEDYQLFFSILGVFVMLFQAVILGVTALILRGTWKSQEKITKDQILGKFIEDYRSPTMLNAAQTLWDLYNINDRDKDKMTGEYRRIYEYDRSKLRDMEFEKRKEYVEFTLHNQRRLVSHFYHQLAQYYKDGLLSKEEINTHWSERDLQIIARIISPIEDTFPDLIPKLEPIKDDDLNLSNPLTRFYKDFRDYESYKDC